ncbi:MAG: LptF/LptG family permease [Bacteroidota bacterium]
MQSTHAKNIKIAMKLLDRYILKKFLYAFLFVLLMLTIIITLIDSMEKNGQFMKYKLAYEEIVKYYCYGYIPFVINFITPISVFIATVFVTSRLAQRTEIIAIMSSGVDFLRFLVPYLAVAMTITLCNFALTGWGLAKANRMRISFETEYMDRIFDNRSQHLHIRIAPDRYFYVEHYRAYRNLGTNVTIETIKDNQLLEKLSAKYISWLQEEEKWQLRDWTLRKIDGLEEHIQLGSTLDINLGIHPSDLDMTPKMHEMLTLPELNAQIKALKSKGADSIHIFLTEKYTRYMSPFAAIILTIIGIMVSAHKSRRGMSFQIAVGFILAFIYIALLLFSKGVAEAKGTHLLLTVWVPNIVFSVLGVVLYKVVPK